jgi:hypothetical protein
MTTFSLPSPSKFYPYRDFGLKINHLATLTETTNGDEEPPKLKSENGTLSRLESTKQFYVVQNGN